MKRIIVLVLVLVGCVKFSDAQIETYPEKYGFKVWTGQMVPDFEVKMTNGKTVKMKKLRGKVVLLDFVGVHCGPCIAGLKKFEKGIFERFKGKDLVVIPILVKYKNLEEDKKFQERLGFTFPFGLDEDFGIASLFYNQGIPRYFVVDRKGKIVYHGPSYMPGTWEVMLEAIDKALKEKK